MDWQLIVSMQTTAGREQKANIAASKDFSKERNELDNAQQKLAVGFPAGSPFSFILFSILLASTTFSL